MSEFEAKTNVPPVALLGDILINNKGEEIATSKAFEDVDIVGLYFSAHWCPPCRQFTPLLSERYTKLREAGKKVEIVFLSSDSDEDSFKSYHSSMSFLALPYSDRERKNEIANKFDVRGIPNLKLLDAKSGEVICSNARSGIGGANFIEDFPYLPKPVYDIGENVNGINGAISLLIMMEAFEDAGRKKEIVKSFTEIAIKQIEKNKASSGERMISKFWTATSGKGPGASIRKLMNLNRFTLPHEHELMENKKSPSWYCDGCNKNDPEAKRFTCIEAGCDFDFCLDCFEASEKDIKEEDKQPIMAILDLSDDNEGYYQPLGENNMSVTQENIEKFISDFADAKLEKKELQK